MASTSRPTVRRGEVWTVQLDPVAGSEIAKTRPCAIVQVDLPRDVGNTTIVVPFTDAAGKSPSVIRPLVEKGQGGLPKQSLGVCHQVRVVDKIRLRKRLGTLPAVVVQKIDAGLAAILDINR